jgi:hypothetical protein
VISFDGRKLLVRFQHLYLTCRSCGCKSWTLKNHEKPLKLAELKNLAFENDLRRNRDSNIKFAPRDADAQAKGGAGGRRLAARAPFPANANAASPGRHNNPS